MCSEIDIQNFGFDWHSGRIDSLTLLIYKIEIIRHSHTHMDAKPLVCNAYRFVAFSPNLRSEGHNLNFLLYLFPCTSFIVVWKMASHLFCVSGVVCFKLHRFFLKYSMALNFAVVTIFLHYIFRQQHPSFIVWCSLQRNQVENYVHSHGWINNNLRTKCKWDKRCFYYNKKMVLLHTQREILPKKKETKSLPNK